MNAGTAGEYSRKLKFHFAAFMAQVLGNISHWFREIPPENY